MTYVCDNPAEFADDALAGFCDAYSSLVTRVPGGVVRTQRASEPKVAVLFGGGSGHYPAFAGLVGPGMGDGAVCGNVFTSPSAQQAITVAKAAHYGRGVVFSYGNYAGDVMNFGIATDKLLSSGIQTANVVVTDDVASAPEPANRRGIAGDFMVYKVLGAAAERGHGLEEVVELGRRANAYTRTIGVAFEGCTMPGAVAPLFALPPGQMGLGLGIHGEPGIADVALPPATDLGRLLVERALSELPGTGSGRVAVILNGLGATKYEELFVLWKTVGPALRDAGLEIVAPEVGELVTSLDMAGVSLTLMHLDEDLDRLWLDPTVTPAFKRGEIPIGQGQSAVSVVPTNEATVTAPGSIPSQAAAATAVSLLRRVQATIHEAAAELGRIDAIAGDGDHGRGMVRGIDAAVIAAGEAALAHCGVGDVLAAGGDAWAEQAGGTSGVLWGAGLRAFGEHLGNDETPDFTSLVGAVHAFARQIQELGGASLGDKTMIDALLPFADSLEEQHRTGHDVVSGWVTAAEVATRAAEGTTELVARKGRSRPLGERSLGTPDPGATSLALILTAVGLGLAEVSE